MFRLLQIDCLFPLSLGIPEDERDGQKDKALRAFRLEAIHVRGFGHLSAEDIAEYFKQFNPVSFEWVDKNSANVIWALPASPANAMIALSRPIVRRDEGEEDEELGSDGEERGEPEKVEVVEEPASEELGMEVNERVAEVEEDDEDKANASKAEEEEELKRLKARRERERQREIRRKEKLISKEDLEARVRRKRFCYYLRISS